MCGITGAFKARHKMNTDADTLALAWALYQDQSNRGTKGYGITIADDTGRTDVLRATDSTTAYVDVKLWPVLERDAGRSGTAQGAMLHHRWPTSTDNTLQTTHPFLVHAGKNAKTKLYVCHNGIISNDDDIKAIHESKGIRYQSEISEGVYNDSEACAWEFAKVLQDPRNRVMRTLGGQAIAALETDLEGKALAVYLATNGSNPLGYMISNGVFMFASELEGEGVTEMEAGQLVRFDLETGKLTKGKIKFAIEKPFKYEPTFGREYGTNGWKERLPTVFKSTGEQVPLPKSVTGFSEAEQAGTECTDAPNAFLETVEEDEDKINETVTEYMETLADKDTAMLADIEGTVKIVRTALETMRDKATMEYQELNPITK